MTRVVVLGGGPAGLGAAYRLRREGRAEVLLLEQGQRWGGNAASFTWNGHALDLGSHRLHPSCHPAVLADVQELLGDDLLDRPRHGRIRLLGRWIRFPLRPADLVLHAPPGFLAGAALDAARKALPRREPDEQSFASVLERGLGATICRHFYFPYAWKLWGADPAALSAVQARKRVAAGSLRGLARKVLGQVPGLRRPGAGRFFYPRGGFGRISDAYSRAAADLGAELRPGHRVVGIEPRSGGGLRVTAQNGAGPVTVDADHVWSTLPLTAVARGLTPAPPREVLEAVANVRYRSMLLVYLELPTARFTEYDAHYFPGPDVRITRLSEPRNYGLATEPQGRTAICAELPCDAEDEVWRLPDAELAALVAADLARADLTLPAEPTAVRVERLRHAYPIYPTGYEEPVERLLAHLEQVPGLLTYGRQGLFAHDNTHHALHMAYSAVGCLRQDGRFDSDRWADHRREFESHVVED